MPSTSWASEWSAVSACSGQLREDGVAALVGGDREQGGDRGDPAGRGGADQVGPQPPGGVVVPGAARVPDLDHADRVQQQRSLGRAERDRPVAAFGVRGEGGLGQDRHRGFGVDRQQRGHLVHQDRRARLQAGGQVVSAGRGPGPDGQWCRDRGSDVPFSGGQGRAARAGQGPPASASWARSTSRPAAGYGGELRTVFGLVIGVGDHGQGVGPGLRQRPEQPSPEACVGTARVHAQGQCDLPAAEGDDHHAVGGVEPSRHGIAASRSRDAQDGPSRT